MARACVASATVAPVAHEPVLARRALAAELLAGSPAPRLLHGDLHPGNVFVQADGGLAIIDCGMVGRLAPAMKDRLIDILHAVLSEDLETLARCFFDLAIPSGKVNYSEFEADAIEIADRYLGGVPLSEIKIEIGRAHV